MRVSYRIMLNIYLKCPEKFAKLIPMLGGFHMAKCVQHCIGKYIMDSMVETKILGVNIAESVLDGKHCHSKYCQLLLSK